MTLFLMNSQNDNNKRIAKNTLLLYVRMLFSMLVSLYTSRAVLQTLGVEDYGIYNVVGGFVAMFSLISSSLSSAVSRFLTFELGAGDFSKLKQIFATSLFVHLILAIIVLFFMETIGIWFLNTKMTIPLERLHAANWVFHASILSFILSLIVVPYDASIVSHERLNTFAYIGILNVLLKLSVVLFIAHSTLAFDSLIVYALLLVAVSVFIQFIYIYYCRKHFEECRFHFIVDKSCLKEIGTFAGWNFIGSTAGILKDHGVNILLNMFLGPVVNAARGISNSVNATICLFAGNFMTALNPQIIKSFASGESAYTTSLVERGSRFSFYIVFILALPILLETDFVLDLWLGQYPAHTVNFVRLVLLLSMCDLLSNTLVTLQQATGRIRNYQLAVGGTLLLNFPLSYFCLENSFPPESVFIVALLISFVCLFLRLVFLNKMVHLSIKQYLRNVCCNVFLVSLCSIVIPVMIRLQMPSGWERFVVVGGLSVLCTGISVCVVGCSSSERYFFMVKMREVQRKLFK